MFHDVTDCLVLNRLLILSSVTVLTSTENCLNWYSCVEMYLGNNEVCTVYINDLYKNKYPFLRAKGLFKVYSLIPFFSWRLTWFQALPKRCLKFATLV